jgi:hypothetical protein
MVSRSGSPDGEALAPRRPHQGRRRGGLRPARPDKARGGAGLSKQLLSFIAADDREVTDDVYRRVAEALAKEADRMRAVGLKLGGMALRMLRELGERPPPSGG